MGGQEQERYRIPPRASRRRPAPITLNTDWEFGNQFNAYYVDMAQAELDVWNVTKKLE